MSKPSTYQLKENLKLECGEELTKPVLGFHTYGQLNHDHSNVVWIFHALTANSNPIEWWPGLVGEDHFITPDKYFIVCVNMLSSCYGSEQPHNFDFPLITIRDMVQAYRHLADHLGIKKVFLGIGGSMGGQQLLEWNVQQPDFFEFIVPMATNAVHSPWAIAFNEAQRMAIKSSEGNQGVDVARAIGMLSYRAYKTFDLTQKDSDNRLEDFSASSYQQYQGQKLANRFDMYSYYYLSKAMDSHNIGRYFESVSHALNIITAKALVIGFETDILFPIEEQRIIAQHIPNSKLFLLHSNYGHDGFLIETQQVSKILEEELRD
ncbi:MAG: homoserine O-acetyltransferase [Bacteroidota bacterium]